MPSNLTINNATFPEGQLAIGTLGDVEGVCHYKLTCPIKYLCQLVLASLKGIHQSSGIVASTAPHSLTMWIPEAIVMAVLAATVRTNSEPPLSTVATSDPPTSNLSNIHKTHTIESDNFGLSLRSLQHAFVTLEINAPTLATLIEALMASNPPHISMLVISASLIQVINDVSKDDTSKLELWCCYIEVIASLPQSLAQSLDAEVITALNTQESNNQLSSQSVVSQNPAIVFYYLHYTYLVRCSSLVCSDRNDHSAS